MSYDNKFLNLNLQLFAEGGGADGGTSGDGANGVNGGVPGLSNSSKNPLANVKYGIQDNGQTATANNADDRNAKFEELIKGEYKDLYDARVQDTIQRRLKGSKETVDKFNALTPTLELLGRKYGVDVNDIEALNKAIDEDDSYFEDEALEKGISVEQLKEIRKMERENSELKRQMREAQSRENADRIYSEWMGQAESLKQIYPTFALEAELQNPKFVNLLKNNVDMKSAFEVIHKDELMTAAMQFTAQQTQRQMANSIMARGSRPVENGMSSQSSAVVKSDVAQLSKEDRQEIIRRVARGEKIRF